MRKLKLLKSSLLRAKTLMLLTAVAVMGSGTAVADTTIGNVANGWQTDGSYTDAATLSEGQMRTFTFTVDNLGTTGYDSYCLNITKGNSTAVFNENNYLFFRSSDFWYTIGATGSGQVYNANTFGETSVNSVITGATVVMTVKRQYQNVIVSTEITTTSSAKYYHYYVLNLPTTDDVYVFLAADFAVLTISDDTTTDISLSNPIGMLIGAEDNSNDWSASWVKNLGRNEVLNLHFKSYANTSITEIHKTWTFGFTYNTNDTDYYFDLSAGYGDPWGTLCTNAVTSSVTRTGWPNTNAGIMTALNEADVTLTIARSESVVTMYALITPTSGDPFTLKCVFEPNATNFADFANGDISVRLVGRACHMYNYYPISKVNAEVSSYGWSTFSSPYKLDFSGVSGLTAHAVTGNSGTAVTMADVSVAAANTGLLLESSTTGSATYYNIPISTSDAYSGTNLMVAGTGTSVSYASGYTKYVLGVSGSDKAEFQQLTDGGSSATVATGKAYLQFTSAVGARSLKFDDSETTGILQTANCDETSIKNYYSLSGQRIAQPTKGLYIVNGKKVVVK